MSGGYYSVFLDGDDHTQWLLDDPLADGAPFDSGFAFGRAQRVEALGELTASVTTRPGEPRDISWTISLVPSSPKQSGRLSSRSPQGLSSGCR